MKKLIKSLSFILFLCTALTFIVPNSSMANAAAKANPKDLNFSISDVPAKTMLIELLKAMRQEYKDGTISYKVYPAARALNNVKNGTSDAMLPYIQNPKLKEEGLETSSQTLWKSIFVLYTNKSNKKINTENVYKYKLEVHPGHSSYFNNSPESDPPGGLQKVNSGRIDGYITAMAVGDPLVKKLNLKNIKRTQFALFDTVAVFKDNNSGKGKEKVFSDLIKTLKSNGKFQEIMKAKLSEKFVPDPQK